MPREHSDPVRAHVKETELAAERALLAVLETAIDGGVGGSVGGNLSACLAVANIVADSEDRASLDVLEREATALAQST